MVLVLSKKVYFFSQKLLNSKIYFNMQLIFMKIWHYPFFRIFTAQENTLYYFKST